MSGEIPAELFATSHGDNPITAVLRYGRLVQPPEIRANLLRLDGELLAPVRARWGWVSSSGYRCPRVNLAADGSANSAHLVGLADDGRPLRGDFGQVIEWLAEEAQAGLPLDRAIYEVRPGREWLHLQLRELSAPAQRPAFFLSPTVGGYLLMPPGQLALLARRLP